MLLLNSLTHFGLFPEKLDAALIHVLSLITLALFKGLQLDAFSP